MVLIFIDKKALCVFYFIVFIFSSGKLLTLNILRCDDGSLHILFLSFKSSLTFLMLLLLFEVLIPSGRFNALYLTGISFGCHLS